MKLKFETLHSESLDFVSHPSPFTRIIKAKYAEIEMNIPESFNRVESSQLSAGVSFYVKGINSTDMLRNIKNLEEMVREKTGKVLHRDSGPTFEDR